MDFAIKPGSISKEVAHLKKLIDNVYEHDLKLLKDELFSWEDIVTSPKDEKFKLREDFTLKMQYLNTLINNEIGLFVKFDKLKELFKYEYICMYLRIESQNIITNPFVAVLFKLYFNIHFFEISQFAVSINSNHLSKFDILSRCLIRYNTYEKVLKKDEKKLYLDNIINAVLKFLRNSIWDFNKWWSEYPIDMMQTTSNDVSQYLPQTGLEKYKRNQDSNSIDTNKRAEAINQKFNIEMTSQYVNLSCLLYLLEFGLYPLKKIDGLIE